MRNPRFVVVAIALLLVSITSIGLSAQSASPQAAVAPAEFVRTVSAGGAKEVELARLAIQKATNAEVKAFANRMIADHSKANSQLAALAAKKSWSVSNDPSGQKADVDKLSALSGAAFDRAYMDLMVENHQKTLTLMDQQAKSGSDPELKAWAGKTSPTVQDHLKQARTTRAKLGS